MLRLTEIKLPLGHAPDALRAAIAKRLRVSPGDILNQTVIRCGHDARKKSAIALIYTVDVAVKDEAAVLARAAGDRNIRLAPDTEYKFVAQAPQAFRKRRAGAVYRDFRAPARRFAPDRRLIRNRPCTQFFQRTERAHLDRL